MSEQCRLFEAGPDPFGRMWKVQFRWLQTGISIRHADTVDVKFFVTPDGGSPEEKVVALPHEDLLALFERRGHKLSDPACLRIAAAHIKHMIETFEDMDKTLVTVKPEEMAAYDEQVNAGPASLPKR
jgi:hypothetical protein